MTEKASALTFPKKYISGFLPERCNLPLPPLSSRIKNVSSFILSYKGYIFIVFR